MVHNLWFPFVNVVLYAPFVLFRDTSKEIIPPFLVSLFLFLSMLSCICVCYAKILHGSTKSRILQIVPCVGILGGNAFRCSHQQRFRYDFAFDAFTEEICSTLTLVYFLQVCYNHISCLEKLTVHFYLFVYRCHFEYFVDS